MPKIKTNLRLKLDKTKFSDLVRAKMLIAINHTLMTKGDVRSIAGIAARAGFAPAMVSRWRDGNGWPTIENVGSMCDEFGFAPNWFYGIGGMYGDKETQVRLQDLEKRIDFVENKIGIKREKVRGKPGLLESK